MYKDVLVVWNGSAGSAKVAATLRRELDEHSVVKVKETGSYAESVDVASHDAGEADLVVAAGGDGTVSAVINGLMNRSHAPPLAILPLGTANNLCRALEYPLDAIEAIQLIERSTTRSIDLVETTTAKGSTFFANVASGGNSERVIERLTDEVKQSWGAWSYLRSAVPVVADLRGFDTSIQLDDNPPERHNVWNVIVANTHIAAGGLPVAPRASIDDGLLDVIIVLDGTPLDTTRLAAEFFLGDYLEDDRVIYQTARRIRVQSAPEISFVADGETITGQPCTFIVKPCALRVVVPLG